MSISDLINIPTVQSQVDAFWQYAAPRINRAKVRPTSLINLLVNSLIASNQTLYQVLSSICSNLTDITQASGGWLDLLGSGFYDLTRLPSQATSGVITITNLTGSPISNPSLTNPQTGITYTSNTTLVASTDTPCSFSASVNGPAGNCNLSALQSNASSSYVVSSANLSDQSWISIPGQNTELDGAYINRCLAQITMQSAGVAASVAARIKYGVALVGRVSCTYASPYSNIYNVYIAAPGGVLNSASAIASATTIALAYTSGSTAPVVSAASPVNLRLIGTLYAARGTSANVIQTILSGLSDWINSLPISDGNSGTQIKMWQVFHQINTLDTLNNLNFASIAAYVGGTKYNAVDDVLPNIAGSVWVADISAIRVVYQ